MTLQLLETNSQQNQNDLGLPLYLAHLACPPLPCHANLLALDDYPLVCLEHLQIGTPKILQSQVLMVALH